MAKDILKSIKSVMSFFKWSGCFGGWSAFVAFPGRWRICEKVLPIRWPCKAVFIPNRTALVEGAGDCAYYYLDLKTGEILWITKKSSGEAGKQTALWFPRMAPRSTICFMPIRAKRCVSTQNGSFRRCIRTTSFR